MSTGTTLLIVEDDVELLGTLKSIFAKQFSTILTAINGKIAQNILKDNTPDLILSDIQMPDFSGIDLIKVLRSEGKDIPIVIMSSSSDKNDVLKVLKLGVSDYVEKPFKKKDLELAIHRTLEIVVRQNNLQELISKHGSESAEVIKLKKLIGLFKIVSSQS